MSDSNWIELPSRDDGRGSLVAVESGSDIPFDIKRVYYIYGTVADASRGYHAHIALKQVVICVSGKCRIVLDNGQTREEWWLESPDKGLYLEGLIWREMHDFTPGCVLLVLASHHYDENDYIRDYSAFLEEVRNAS